MNIIALLLSFLKSFHTSLPNSFSLDQLIFSLKDASTQLLQSVCAQLIEQMDQIYRESSQRKQIYHIKMYRSRTLLTSIGAITFTKTTYVDKRTNVFYSYIEDYLGIDKWAKMTFELEALLINEAISTTYERASKFIPNLPLSKQTIYNKVKSYDTDVLINTDIPQISSNRKTLYIEVDEAHVSLQREKSKSNHIAKLVLVHLGHDPTTLACKRKKLIHKTYFTPQNETNTEFWERVIRSIDTIYSLDQFDTVFVSGDGGHWIRENAKVFGQSIKPEIIQVLDRFHFNQCLRSIFSGEYSMIQTAKEIISIGHQEAFTIFCQQFYQTNSKKHRLSQARFDSKVAYITSFWNEIKNQSHFEYQTGCSMEGHISHYLAQRMTSRPKGFSLRNSINLSQLKIYKLNGFIIDYLTIQKLKHRSPVLLDKENIQIRSSTSNIPALNGFRFAYRNLFKQINNSYSLW